MLFEQYPFTKRNETGPGFITASITSLAGQLWGKSTFFPLSCQFLYLSVLFQTHLKEAVSVAVEELLRAYGVRDLVDTGETLQKDVKILQENMDMIRTTNQKVSAGISNLKGQFEVIYQLVVPELAKVCQTDFGPVMNAECADLQVSFFSKFTVFISLPYRYTWKHLPLA